MDVSRDHARNEEEEVYPEIRSRSSNYENGDGGACVVSCVSQRKGWEEVQKMFMQKIMRRSQISYGMIARVIEFSPSILLGYYLCSL